MTENYTIEQLEKVFKDHSENFLNEKRLGFNISEALHVICREINSLKRTINLMNEDDETFDSIDIENCIRSISGVCNDLLGNDPID